MCAPKRLQFMPSVSWTVYLPAAVAEHFELRALGADHPFHDNLSQDLLKSELCRTSFIEALNAHLASVVQVPQARLCPLCGIAEASVVSSRFVSN